jgi:hypothetical protein
MAWADASSIKAAGDWANALPALKPSNSAKAVRHKDGLHEWEFLESVMILFLLAIGAATRNTRMDWETPNRKRFRKTASDTTNGPWPVAVDQPDVGSL